MVSFRLSHAWISWNRKTSMWCSLYNFSIFGYGGGVFIPPSLLLSHTQIRTYAYAREKSVECILWLSLLDKVEQCVNSISTPWFTRLYMHISSYNTQLTSFYRVVFWMFSTWIQENQLCKKLIIIWLSEVMNSVSLSSLLEQFWRQFARMEFVPSLTT